MSDYTVRLGELEHLQPPDIPWAPNTFKKCVCATANTFLVYLEPRERVCWLQMSFFHAYSAPPNVLARFVGPLPCGEKKLGKERADTTHASEINYWLRSLASLNLVQGASYGLPS